MLVIDETAFFDFLRNIDSLREHYSILACEADNVNSPEEASFYRGKASTYDSLSEFLHDLADKHISVGRASGRLWATSISDR